HEGVKIATDVVAPGQVTDSPALRLAAEARRRQREAENLILADPFVQAMMRDFGGTIVPGSLKADAGLATTHHLTSAAPTPIQTIPIHSHKEDHVQQRTTRRPDEAGPGHA